MAGMPCLHQPDDANLRAIKLRGSTAIRSEWPRFGVYAARAAAGCFINRSATTNPAIGTTPASTIFAV
jgi:hypothetical protein